MATLALHGAVAAVWLQGGGTSAAGIGTAPSVLVARLIDANEAPPAPESSEPREEPRRPVKGSDPVPGALPATAPSAVGGQASAFEASASVPRDTMIASLRGATVASERSAEHTPIVPPSDAARQTSMELALPPAPSYFSGSALDRGPVPLDDVALEYPEEGKLREGTVMLRILISETGQIDDISVVRSFPKVVFDKAAINAFSAIRFAPGMRAGAVAKSQVTIEVHFAPFNRGGRVSGQGY